MSKWNSQGILAGFNRYGSVVGYSVVTSACVYCGVLFAFCMLPPGQRKPASAAGGPLHGMLAWDGEWYQKIIDYGYDYSDKVQSSIPFFPMYPDLASIVGGVTRLSSGASLLLVSNASFVLAFMLLASLVRARSPSPADESNDKAVTYACLAMGLWPSTFFFRMAYSESLFLAISLGAFVAMQRRAPAWLIAFICGAAMQTRPVGVALLGPFILYLSHTSVDRRQLIVRALLYLPLACWGLAAFMFYQWHEFGTPFAFVNAQRPYNARLVSSLAEASLSLVTLEPLWGPYFPDRCGYWRQFAPNCPLFNLAFLNPIFFCVSGAIVMFGAWRRWITSGEVLFSLGVLVVPYVTHSYPKCGVSLARYAIVCFPVYIVLGRMLAFIGVGVSAALLSLCACLLCIYSGMFSTWHWFY